MPIWLRRFTFQKLKNHYEKVNEETSNKNVKSNKDIKGPDIKPAYSTKASK